MRYRLLATFATVLFSVCTQIASAHEGHGHPDLQHGPAHYLASPHHFMPWMAGITVAGGIGIVVFRCLLVKKSTARNQI